MSRFISSALLQSLTGQLEDALVKRSIHATQNVCWEPRNNRRHSGFRQNDFQHRRSDFSRQQMRGNEFNLSPKQWASENLKPFNKNFSDMIIAPESVSQNEFEEFKKLHNITVKGSSVVSPVTQFSQIKFSSEMQEYLKQENFTVPTPIQAQCWPIVLSGKDLIGIGQTGSGKTLGFSLPAIIHLLGQNEKVSGARCLVLAPTRELAQQIDGVMSKVLRTSKFNSVVLFGGSSKENQIRKIRKLNPEVYIATPGRLLDLLTDGYVDVSQCTYVVLDEADRMLDMGFEPQIRQVISQIRPDRQTLLWSATWPREVHELANSLTKEPVQVNIGSTELIANANITQEFIFTGQSSPMNKLIETIEDGQDVDNKILVFANTKFDVDTLYRVLHRSSVNAVAVHGGLSQARRDGNLEAFRSGRSNVLVATNVAARGIDVSGISLVINYALPANIEDYVHRIGRTARGSNTGRAISFFKPEDQGLAKDLIDVLQKADQDVPSELVDMVQRKYRQHNRGLSRNEDFSY